jgi:hypothetical protein
MMTFEAWKWVFTFSAIFTFAVIILVLAVFKIAKNYEEDRRVREEGPMPTQALSKYEGQAH